MTRDDRRYARFYFPEFIRDYEEIYRNDAALSTWMRLLVIAEQMWPMAGFMPLGVSRRGLKMLVDAGLVTVTDLTFSIKGQQEERERRQESARQSATLRWNRPKIEGGRPASRRTRFKVLERDGHRCRYCGRTADEVAIDVDHVVPIREGGSDDLENLVAACVDCNMGKSGHPLRAHVDADARALPSTRTSTSTREGKRDSNPVEKRAGPRLVDPLDRLA